METSADDERLLDVGKIRRLRERLDLSQEEAAECAGLGNRQRWNDIESGRKASITLTTLASIADALAVDWKELLLHRPGRTRTRQR